MKTATPAETLRVVTQAPFCAETVLERQRGLITPNELFYVRSNFAYPAPPAGVSVRGAVRWPRLLTAADLKAMRSKSLVVTLECAGNGRSFLTPAVAGEQWELGAVATAAWTGAELASVLAESGLEDGVVEIAFEGADGFARSLPAAAAMDPDVLLAFEMNGEPLPHEHGGPLRLVVPRCYGMASVKWLSGIVALKEPFSGHFQAERYVINGEPVREMNVRAVITEPVAYSVVARTGVVVAGYAWTGRGRVTSVQLSTGEDAAWREARLIDDAGPYGWTRWESFLRPSRAGRMNLLARAADSTGRVQPLAPSWNRLGYCNNAAVPHTVIVDA